MELNNNMGTADVPKKFETETEETLEDSLIVLKQDKQSGNTAVNNSEDSIEDTIIQEANEAEETAATTLQGAAMEITAGANPGYISLAVAKIDAELKSFTGGLKEKAVSDFVAVTLTKFCHENVRFAEVVYKTTRTLSDVCREVMAGTGNHISDFEVYRSVAQSYFPNAEMKFHMEIIITGTPPTDDEIKRAPKVQAPVTTVHAPRNQAPIVPTPVKEPEYFETIHLEL